MSRDGRYNSQVKARVFVSLKRTVLDPQGQTVRSALTGLGYQSVSDVRQGKFFDIALTPGLSRRTGPPRDGHAGARCSD